MHMEVGNIGKMLATMIVLPKEINVPQGAPMVVVPWMLNVVEGFQVELVHEDHEKSCQLWERMIANNSIQVHVYSLIIPNDRQGLTQGLL